MNTSGKRIADSMFVTYSVHACMQESLISSTIQPQHDDVEIVDQDCQGAYFPSHSILVRSELLAGASRSVLGDDAEALRVLVEERLLVGNHVLVSDRGEEPHLAKSLLRGRRSPNVSP